MLRICLFLMAVVFLSIAGFIYSKKWLHVVAQKKKPSSLTIDRQYGFILKSFITLSFFVLAFVFGFLNQGVNIIPIALFLFFALIVSAIYTYRPKWCYLAAFISFLSIAFLVFNCSGKEFYFLFPLLFGVFATCFLWLFMHLDKISFLSLITTFSFIVCFFLKSLYSLSHPFWQGAQLYLLYFLFLIFLAQVILYKATHKMMLPRLGMAGSLFIGFILTCYTLYFFTALEPSSAFVLTSFYWVEYLVALVFACKQVGQKLQLLYTPERKSAGAISFVFFIKKVFFLQTFLAVMASVIKNTVSASLGVVALSMTWFYLSLFILKKQKIKLKEVFQDVCGGVKELALSAKNIYIKSNTKRK